METHSSKYPLGPRPLYDEGVQAGLERESQLKESLEVIQALMSDSQYVGPRNPESIRDMLRNRSRDKRIQI